MSRITRIQGQVVRMTKIERNGVETDFPHLVGSEVSFTEEPAPEAGCEGPIVPPGVQRIIDDFQEQRAREMYDRGLMTEGEVRLSYAAWPEEESPRELFEQHSMTRSMGESWADDAARWTPEEGWQ